MSPLEMAALRNASAPEVGPPDFYARLPVFTGFTHVMEPDLYQPLPDDWLLGLSDVVDSTKAIAAGRYKVVNTAGAAVIAAVTNALRGRAFPFAFGGDGASFAVGPGDAEAARAALENLARTLSIEWARYGIRTTALTPGAEWSDDDVGDLVAYLVSPGGDYFSGARLGR